MMGIFPTGSVKEREVYRRAVTRVNSGHDQEAEREEELLKVDMKIEEVKTKMLRDNVQLYKTP